MIPSKQAKMQIKYFQEIISNIYNKITLNKSRSFSHIYSDMFGEINKIEKLGVNSDLVFIFKTNDNGDCNFAFNFDYINKEEDDYKVQVSFKPVHFDYQKETISKFKKSKINDKCIYSEKFSVKEFKEKLSLLNKELKNHTINKEIVLSLINTYFFNDEISIKKEIEKGLKYYKQLTNGEIRKV